MAFRHDSRAKTSVGRTGCTFLVVAVVLFAGTRRQGIAPKAHHLEAQAVEDSIRLQAVFVCKQVGRTLRHSKLVYRGPGRYHIIERRQKDQIVCSTWQGRLQFVDTTLIQPGNGKIQ